MVPRNPFAPVVFDRGGVATGGIFGPSAQVVDNAVAILASNTIAVIKAVNGCDTILRNDALMEQWQSFTGIVEAFVKANEKSSWLSTSGAEILAQVDQLQAQLDEWKKKLAAICSDVGTVPEAPQRANTDTPLFSLPTGLIVGSALVLGILIVWKVK